MRHFREDDLEVIRSGQPRVVLEEPITDTRGRVRHLQTTKIPFTFSGTGRPAVLGVSIDISERKAAEEALRRAAKEESLSVLAGGVAHDFNNLLAAILGHASLALKQLPEGSPARRHVEKAASAVERAADLTRQMLAYSGRGHFVVRPTDVNALVRENLPAARGGAAEERAARGAARPGPAAGRRRRGPDPAGADEPGHQRRRGDRRAGRDRHRGHGDEGSGRVRRVAVAGERAAARAGPVRAPRGARRRAGDGRGHRGPDLRAVLHDEVHRAGPRPRRGPRCRARSPGRTERRERPGPGHGLPHPVRAQLPGVRARGRGGGRARPARPDPPPDRRRGGGARHGRRGPRAGGSVGAARRGRGEGGGALPRAAGTDRPRAARPLDAGAVRGGDLPAAPRDRPRGAGHPLVGLRPRRGEGSLRRRHSRRLHPEALPPGAADGRDRPLPRAPLSPAARRRSA